MKFSINLSDSRSPAAMKVSQKVFTVLYRKDEPAAALIPNRNLHKSLKWVIVLAQCFGQIPVTGIGKPDSRSLRFTWRSWRCFYSILTCIGALLLTSTYLIEAMTSGIDIFVSSSIAFHLTTTMVSILFIKLAMEWPQLMRRWGSVEIVMRTYGWPPHLHTRIALLTTVVMSIAAIEYLMVKLHKISLSVKYRCEYQDLIEYYFTIHLYPHIFSTIGYSIWLGIVLQVLNILMTFAWTFNDVFIMVISTALAMRFRQVTARLRVLKKNCKNDNVGVWRESREDYNRLSQLTRSLDSSLSYIVLTSFASNLFFILTQLFNSLRPMRDTVEKIYFFFSFGFLILRTICVSLYGAWIYDESKEPIAVLNSVSSEVYNIEIKRFIEQIKFDTVALTGKNFFYVTRGLILSMAGAVVTYELVLIQFNENLLNDEEVPSNHTENVC